MPVGPTLLDLDEVTDVQGGDKFYLVRGTGVGRDKQVQASLLRGAYDVIITTQAGFEYYFGDGTETGSGTTAGGWSYSESGGNVTVTMPKDTAIFLRSHPSDGVTTHYKYDASLFPYKAYELKTKVLLQTADAIKGEGVDQSIIIKGNNFAKFASTYLDQEAVSAVSTNDFTVADSSNFREGQIVVHDDGVGDVNPYIVIDVPDGTSVLVDRDITGTGAGTLGICQDSISISDLTFDGRGGVDNLGGTLNGRAYEMEYCSQSSFIAKTINVYVDAAGNHGAAFHGNNTCVWSEISNIWHCKNNQAKGGAVGYVIECKIHNIHDCDAPASSGGGVASALRCHIYNIYDCSAATGGGVVDSTYGNIHDIYRCLSVSSGSVARGGGVENCDFSIIYNIYDCIARNTGTGNATGGGVENSPSSKIYNIYACKVIAEGAGGNATGGGVNASADCTINNIVDCECTSTTGNAAGGGVYNCYRSTISNIYTCTTTATTGDSLGGGVAASHRCTISNIHECFSGNDDDDGYGGGAASCGNNGNESIFLGSWTSNACDGNPGAGQYDTLDGCYGIAFLMYDGTAGVQTTEAALDYD